MRPNPPFENLQKILLAKGLPRASARRYLQELADHREDLLLELQQQNLTPSDTQRLADERLGPIDMLAQAAIAKHQSQTLMGRHPRLFFAALPFITVPLLFSLIIGTLALALAATHFFDQGIPPRLHSPSLALFSFFKYAVPAAIGLLYYRATRRRALSRPFRITASTAVILWASLFYYAVNFESPASPHGHLFVGLSLRPNILQALAVAAPILLYAWLSHRLSQKPTLAL